VAGFVPDRVASAPPVAVARLADQLKVDAAELRSYGKRALLEHPIMPMSGSLVVAVAIVVGAAGWVLPCCIALCCKYLDDVCGSRALHVRHR
jgi:hypothetical protein